MISANTPNSADQRTTTGHPTSALDKVSKSLPSPGQSKTPKLTPPKKPTACITWDLEAAQFCAVRDAVHTDATKIVEMVGLLKAVDEAVKNLRENRSAQLRRPEFGGLILDEVCSFAYVAGAFDRRDGLLAREHMRKGDKTA
jgi:hypothetical protein